MDSINPIVIKIHECEQNLRSEFMLVFYPATETEDYFAKAVAIPTPIITNSRPTRICHCQYRTIEIENSHTHAIAQSKFVKSKSATF